MFTIKTLITLAHPDLCYISIVMLFSSCDNECIVEQYCLEQI